MNIAIFKKASAFVAVAFAIVLTFGISNEVSAQRAADTYFISSNDTIIGLTPDQTLRLMIFNGSANTVVPQVRVYTGTGTLLLSGSHTPLASGQFDNFNLNYSDLGQMPGEPGTGRRQVRIEVSMFSSGTEADAQRIRLGWDLVNATTGQTILVGMLLPAIQKVR